MNIKETWEILQVDRTEKAMKTREKFLRSLQSNVDQITSFEVINDTSNISENRTDGDIANTMNSSAIERQDIIDQTATAKENSSPAKVRIGKHMTSKPRNLILSSPYIDEPLLDEPSIIKSKIVLPSLDLKFWTR